MKEAEDKDKILLALVQSETGGSYVNAYSREIVGLEEFSVYKYRLRMDGYLDYKNEEGVFKLWRTPKGTEFLKEGGYQAIEKAKQREVRRQKNDQLWTRASIVISLLALGVSASGLITAEKNLPLVEANVIELKREVDSLKVQLNRITRSVPAKQELTIDKYNPSK